MPASSLRAAGSRRPLEEPSVTKRSLFVVEPCVPAVEGEPSRALRRQHAFILHSTVIGDRGRRQARCCVRAAFAAHSSKFHQPLSLPALRLGKKSAFSRQYRSSVKSSSSSTRSPCPYCFLESVSRGRSLLIECRHQASPTSPSRAVSTAALCRPLRCEPSLKKLLLRI